MQGTGRRFTFGRCLGRGSFGEVYGAAMLSPGGLETQVAVKLLRADIDLNGSAVKRLRDEGKLLSRLNHPAILSVIDLVTLDGRLALITELVEGADLSSFLNSIPPRPLIQALGQVAGALAAANQAPGPDGPLRLVHRDVKPSNIRLERHGRAKLLDFGIARFDASDREVRTASNLVVGSIPYMAPERFIQREVVASSDVFSLGCTLYEGLVGRKFYGTNRVAEISELALHPERFVTFLQERLVGIAVHPMLLGLIVDLVSLEPGDRPPAAMVADRCEEIADQLDGPSLRRWCQEREWPVTEALKGSLEGQTLNEHPAEDAVLSEPALPVIHHQPVVTLEAASLPSAGPTQIRPGTDEISTVVAAPPAESLSELHPVEVDAPAVVVSRSPEIVDSKARDIGAIALFALLGIVVIMLVAGATGAIVFMTILGLLSV